MKRKAVGAITGLLCAALFLSNTAGIRAFAMEEGGQEMRIQEYSPKDDTVGRNIAAIKTYIQNQLKEDLEYDQMSLLEYSISIRLRVSR